MIFLSITGSIAGLIIIAAAFKLGRFWLWGAVPLTLVFLLFADIIREKSGEGLTGTLAFTLCGIGAAVLFSFLRVRNRGFAAVQVSRGEWMGADIHLGRKFRRR